MKLLALIMVLALAGCQTPNRAGYDQIRTGMTTAEVFNILGPVAEHSRANTDGHEIVSYLYQHRGRKSLVCTFRDDRLYSKSQF